MVWIKWLVIVPVAFSVLVVALGIKAFATYRIDEGR